MREQIRHGALNHRAWSGEGLVGALVPSPAARLTLGSASTVPPVLPLVRKQGDRGEVTHGSSVAARAGRAGPAAEARTARMPPGVVACKLAVRGRRVQIKLVVQQPASWTGGVKVALGHTEPPPVCSPPALPWVGRLEALDPLDCWLALEAGYLLVAAAWMVRSGAAPPPEQLPPLLQQPAWPSSWLCDPAAPVPPATGSEDELRHALCAAYVCIAGLLGTCALSRPYAAAAAWCCAAWNVLAIVQGPTMPRARVHALLLFGTAVSALRSRRRKHMHCWVWRDEHYVWQEGTVC